MGKVEDALRDIATDHGGLFTSQAAVAAGIRRDLVVQLADRGRVQRVARGLYRFPSWPSAALQRYHEAVLWPQAQRDIQYAVLSHDSALELYDVYSLNSGVVHVTIPRKTRIVRKTPAWIRFHHADVEPQERTWERGIPTVGTSRAIEDVAPARAVAELQRIVSDARERGLLSEGELVKLASRLGTDIVMLSGRRPGRNSAPTLARVLETLRGQEQVLRRRGILHAGVFGSVARGEATPASDVDIMVDIDYATGFGTLDLIEIEESLSHVLGRRVDVVSAGGLKLGKHDTIRRDIVRAF